MNQPKYKQQDFEKELTAMLAEAKVAGLSCLHVISRYLHDRTVSQKDNFINVGSNHRMPMACSAMWKLWKKQGERETQIIVTTASKQSSTIEIKFDTI